MSRAKQSRLWIQSSRDFQSLGRQPYFVVKTRGQTCIISKENLPILKEELGLDGIEIPEGPLLTYSKKGGQNFLSRC